MKFKISASVHCIREEEVDGVDDFFDYTNGW